MQKLIEVHNLSKSFRKRKSKEAIQAVDDVSFAVQEGEILGLLGPNGAGKSTTIKIICGLIRPDSGKVLIRGLDNQTQRQQAMWHISAVLEGNRNLYWRMTTRENLEYFAGNRGRSRREASADIARLLAQFGLTEKADELVNSLSRGMQQKLAIAVAMIANTEVILLDEPTLGLDVETGYEVRELLRNIAREGRTIIISTHDMPLVQELCQRTVIINQGHVVVDDEVSHLMRLFATRAYEVRLGTALSPQQVQHLHEAFPVVTIAEQSKTFEVNFERDEDIYRLMDILRAEQSPIAAISQTTINFEQIFRQLITRQPDGSNVRHHHGPHRLTQPADGVAHQQLQEESHGVR